MMVTKNQHIELTPLRIQSDQPGYWSIFFARPKNFVFDAGDWIDIQFEKKILKGGITYTISSSPTEDEIRISFREGISEFKKALQAITPAGKLYISQYGNDYNFQIKKNQSNVFIAGGVGIAPFRSMIKEMYDNNTKDEITLIYLNQNDTYLFKHELDMWKEKLANIKVHYITTKGINRKKREKLILSLIATPVQNFYISGPPGMVESTEHLLIDYGVNVRDIRIDSFGGY